MPTITEFPEIIQDVREKFADLFSNEAQRDHFAVYLTGLIVSQNKTVSGITDQFVGVSDQSCLNRFLNEVDWDVEALNRRRLELLQQSEDTRYHSNGVIAIDNVLIDHDGKLIEDVGWLWDHAEQRSKIAHDYLISNYVCPSGKHYPLEFRRFKKRDQCETMDQPFLDHGVLFRQLVDHVSEQNIPGTLAFDCYFSSAENLNYIHGKTDSQGNRRGYVGDLKTNRKLEIRGRSIRADEFAASIDPPDRKEYRYRGQRQWYFTMTVRLPQVTHPVRILILWRNRRDTSPAKVLVTNKIHWDVHRTLNVYRKRWTGTETFHRDGKQNLGMGDCQLRNGQGQTRHMHLVMLAYSLLMQQLRSAKAKRWASQRLTTIGQACQAIINETLRTTIQWVIQNVIENPAKSKHITALLGLI